MYHRGHALLIGVSDYKSGWPQLPNVKNDLRDLTEALTPYFETVDELLNPTVEQLRNRMREFLGPMEYIRRVTFHLLFWPRLP